MKTFSFSGDCLLELYTYVCISTDLYFILVMCALWMFLPLIIIIIEHLLKSISLTVHQSLCLFTLIDMIIIN